LILLIRDLGANLGTTWAEQEAADHADQEIRMDRGRLIRPTVHKCR